jgi:hypothetical protein
VIVLIESDNTHIFIHRRVAEEIHCYVHVVHNFLIIMANGSMMKCGGRCENVKLQMGNYQLKYHMFIIDMDGYDVVLIREWLHTLGFGSMDFKELYIISGKYNPKHTLKGCKPDSP